MPNPRPVLESSRRVVPEGIKPEPLWVLWDLLEKTPRAPWHTGHMYRAEWRGELPEDERPETTYEEARLYASIPPAELDRTHSFPRATEAGEPIDEPIPDRVAPTILLPSNPRAAGFDPPLMYIDFDDVRDPETGEITHEVNNLVEHLDSYTEISRSGTGLHVLVYGALPDGVGRVDEPLNNEGSIEIYDHGRFFGGTWRHVDGTPTEINERQYVVDEFMDMYVPDWDSSSRGGSDGHTPGVDRGSPGDSSGSSWSSSSVSTPTPGSRSDRSPYFDVSLERFAEPATVERDYADGKQGDHPVHGKTTGGDRSTNYNLDTQANRWHCFAHGSGGGPLEMAAIMAGVADCADFQGTGTGSGVSSLTDEQFLETCLYARATLAGFTEDMKPPYRALVAIATIYDLDMADPQQLVLGRTTHKIARAIYNEIDASTVGDA